jgi:hypothetical protein
MLSQKKIELSGSIFFTQTLVDLGHPSGLSEQAPEKTNKISRQRLVFTVLGITETDQKIYLT